MLEYPGDKCHSKHIKGVWNLQHIYLPMLAISDTKCLRNCPIATGWKSTAASWV